MNFGKLRPCGYGCYGLCLGGHSHIFGYTGLSLKNGLITAEGASQKNRGTLLILSPGRTALKRWPNITCHEIFCLRPKNFFSPSF